MLPTLNDLLFFEVIDDNNFFAKIYKARVAEIKDGFLFTEIPMEEQGNKYGIFQIGSLLRVWYIAKDKQKKQFFTQVLGREKLNNFPLMKITLPTIDDILTKQRREFFRVNIRTEFAMRKLSENNIWFVYNTSDLSGGGFSYISDKKETIGGLYEIWLKITTKNNGENLFVKFIGELIRISELNNMYYKNTIKIVNIMEKDRQKIIRFCFEKEIELNNKGLLKD